MDERIKALFAEFTGEALEQMILSKSSNPQLQKIKIRPVLLQNRIQYQVEEFRGTQVFHKNLSEGDLSACLPNWFQDCFHQAELHHRDKDATILLGKKGTVTIRKKLRARLPRNHSCVPADHREQTMTDDSTLADPRGQNMEITSIPAHNREKKRLIPEGSNVPFLKDLGVFTAEGRVVKAKYDKYRQINRFLEFIEDILPELPEGKPLGIVDFGCGKSYLTFAMYYYLKEVCGRELRISGLDLKKDVINNCARLAKEYGYQGLEFQQGDVADYRGEDAVDMMVTLHACDTATDYALFWAVQRNTKVIMSVPCCQHEVNAQLSSNIAEPLLRHGLIKERMAALVTDALRAELLTACGYRVQVLEFIDMEHTPKNILIRAVKKKKVNHGECEQAYERCRQMTEQLGIRPKLMELIYGIRKESGTKNDEKEV